MRKVSVLLAAATVATGLALTATPAAAAGPSTLTLAQAASLLSFEAAAGSVNNVTVSFSTVDDITTIEDANHTIVISGVAANFCDFTDTTHKAVECEGPDRIQVNLGNEDDSAEVLDNDGGAVEVYGQNGDDDLVGSPDGDLLDGGAGNDTISGGAGGDTLIGGVNQDTITGGPGVDEFFGGANIDEIFANDGVEEDVDCGGSPFDGKDKAHVDLSAAVTDNTVRCEILIVS
jgi:Ca2+-binding RTX toxin-like protein